MCGKRSYLSEQHAKEAHRKAGYRIRVYQCEVCGSHHVTNQDKGMKWDDRFGGSAVDGKLAPKMTLEELQAEAKKRLDKAAGRQ